MQCEEKQGFRELKKDTIKNIQDTEHILVAADLNCQIGEKKMGCTRIQRAKAFGLNEREAIFELAKSLDLTIGNLLFQGKKGNI